MERGQPARGFGQQEDHGEGPTLGAEVLGVETVLQCGVGVDVRRQAGDRLPPEPARTGADATPCSDPFTEVYQLHREAARELANRTVHTIMHMGWVRTDDDNHELRMAALVKPNGTFGRLYRHWAVPPNPTAVHRPGAASRPFSRTPDAHDPHRRPKAVDHARGRAVTLLAEAFASTSRRRDGRQRRHPLRRGSARRSTRTTPMSTRGPRPGPIRAVPGAGPPDRARRRGSGHRGPIRRG
ncbi:hypothetical protein B4N89_41605 [Embleya scabrispora]|uniref:Uncharacterized protein n=1 Tax=Embleya scabrispora TaxID=159449 RepID=A0A1T3NL91_9ACTN|nr:hypothetical protein B4N89_41605 [Embleya scabrispora]